MALFAYSLILVVVLGSVQDEQGNSRARAHMGSGNKFIQTERYKEAAEEFAKALRIDPNLTEARQQLAICRFELRDYPAARGLFQQMLAAKENRELALYYLGRIALIEQDFDSAIRLFQSLTLAGTFRDELYYFGVAHFKIAEFAKATEILKQAVSDNPRDFRAHQYLARAYQKLGETQKAEQEFAETQQLHDYYLKGSVVISECRSLLLNGQVERAWQTCSPLLETDDVDKLVAIGMVFGKSGAYKQALEVWDKAISLDADSPEINYNLALTYYHLKDLPKARRYAKAAARLRPGFFEANMLLGTILYMLAEDEAAIQALTRAHQLRPDDEGARKLLAQQLALHAESLIRRKQLQHARDLLLWAVDLRPDSKAIAEKLAQLTRQLSQNP